MKIFFYFNFLKFLIRCKIIFRRKTVFPIRLISVNRKERNEQRYKTKI